MRRVHEWKIAFTLIALSAALALTQAYAQSQSTWPAKPIRIVVPFAPGGTTDILARIMAERLTSALQQPVIAENKPGASGNIGSAEVARSAPDGCTLLLGNTATLVLNPLMSANPGYDPARDLAPVVLLARVPNVLVVNPSLHVRTVQELVERARVTPSGMSYGHSGVGTSLHLSMELFKMVTHIDAIAVSYKGSGPFLQDLVGGHLQMAIDNVPSALPLIQSGKLIALGVTTATPVPALPGVPPIANTVPGFDVAAFFALMAPAGTPASTVTRLARESDRILHDVEVAKRFVQLGMEPIGGTADQLGELLAMERRKWMEVVKVADIRPE